MSSSQRDSTQLELSNKKLKDLNVTHVEMQKEVSKVMGRINKLNNKLSSIEN